MIFIGVAYIYGIISNLTYYILYLPDADYFVPYVFTGILPRLAAGILYIAIASIIHKENFSAKIIKVLGWTVFALEIINRVVSGIVVLQSIYFADLVGLVYLLFVVILMLYLSVFKVNTLRDVSAPVVNRETVYQSTYQVNSAPSTPETTDAELPQTTDKVIFCRKCGEKLIENSQFCTKCGTQIVAVKNKPKAFVKCQICENSVEHVTYCEIKDDMGTRYRSLCDDCIAKYNAK